MGRPVVSESAPGHDCVYATSGWGIHDDRWVGGLRSVGYTPIIVSLGRDATDVTALRLAVREAGRDLPVLAGPLHSITRHLVDLPVSVVGLSWGYDMDELGDPSWLAGLDGLIVDSSTNHDTARRAGLPSDRITFLPWGIDLERFPLDGPYVVPLDLGLASGSPLIVSLRAHEPLYRVDDIVEAFTLACADVPEAALVIGHDGSMTPALKDRVLGAGLDGRVRFVGRLPEPDLAPLLRGATAYVTAAAADGTSVTLLKAMACGAPVVASATPGNRGWVDEGRTGRLFEVGDVEGLAGRLIEACRSDSADQVRAARRLVERDADWQANLPRLRSAMAAAAASSHP